MIVVAELIGACVIIGLILLGIVKVREWIATRNAQQEQPK